MRRQSLAGGSAVPGVRRRAVAERRAVIAVATLLIAGTAVAVKGVVPGTNGRIAFASDRTGTFEVFAMIADGSDVRQITPDGDTNPTTNALAQDREPAWSPDGTRMAFRSDRAGNNDVWVMNADGSGATNLTNHPAAEGEMSWSPDGTRLVFRRDIPMSGEQLFVINADGTGETQLTSTGQSFRPDWSPDGTRIVFAGDRGAGEQIFVMNADGSNQPQQLTAAGGGQFDPAWSPDGSLIAFARESAVGAGDADIIVMTATGSAEQNITSSAPHEYYPAWSPDGSRIAIARTPPAPVSADTGGDIFVLAPDGSGLTNITNTPDHDTDPDWQRRSTPTPTPTPTTTPTAAPSAAPEGGVTDLAVTISASSGSVRRGRTVGYTIIVRNNGPADAPRIELVTTLPSRLSFVSVTGNGCNAPAPGGVQIECVLGPLPARQSSVVVVEARGRRTGRATTAAEVLAVSSIDPEPSDNRVIERVRVSGRRSRAR
jgi:uncharacterized repeat protein (TIGR01451 family)